MLLSYLRQQAQYGQADQKAIWRLPRTQAECDAKRITLGYRQTVTAVQERRAQLMQTGERQFHFGLNARRSRNLTTGRPLQQVFQQRRLADACLAAQDQHAALTRPHARYQAIQRLALAVSTAQPWARITGAHNSADPKDGPSAWQRRRRLAPAALPSRRALGRSGRAQQYAFRPCRRRGTVDRLVTRLLDPVLVVRGRQVRVRSRG